MSNTTKVILCLVIACVIYGYLNNKPEGAPDARFENDWQSGIDNEHFAKISKLMVENNIGGCGEMYSRENTEHNNEFLIACTSDGSNFKYYLAWPNIDKIMAVKDEGFAKPNQ